MSERGYDSDAQYIGSPRNLNLSPTGSGREFSPPGQGYARTELSDLSERSTEWVVDGFDGLVDRRGLGGSLPREELGGLSGGSEASERGALLWQGGSGTERVGKGSSSRTVGVENAVDQPVRGSEAETLVAPTEQPEESQKSTPVLPQSEPVIIDEANDSCPPHIDESNVVQEDHCVEADTKPLNPDIKPMSEILVNKRRVQDPPNRSVSEVRSVHLGDMNIHRMLASPSLVSTSITSRVYSQNPSVDENKREDVSGTRSISESSGTKILLQQGQRQKQSTMFYSPRSSASSYAPSICQPPPKTWGHSGIEKYLTKLERQTAGIRSPRRVTPQKASTRGTNSKEPSEANPNESRGPAVEVLKSRFIENLEKDRPTADETFSHGQTGETLPMPRKVSVGWMSGGRRTGYGYTMVAPDEKENIASRTDLGSGCTGDADDLSRSATPSKLNGSSVSVNLIPNVINRLGDRHWSDATAFLRDTSAKDTPDGETLTTPLWTRMASRMKGQNNGTNTPRPMPGHWPVFDSEQSSIKESLHPRKQTPILGPRDGSFLKRTMTRIYSTSSLQVRRRTAMESTNDACRATKGRSMLKASGSILNRKGSGDFRFRMLNLNLNRKKGRKSVDDDVPIFQVKHCGWSREEMSGRRVAGTGWGSGLGASPSGSGSALGSGTGMMGEARDAVKSLSLEQIASDDTTEDLASMYQDCLEIIPGSVDEIVGGR